ncbi:MAG: hypothetical protein B7Z41_05960 [Rhizobiales bacterium 12-66-7]|nr:MAG: hypothetical protein B7Z41_05960 [Rhizobiales bacterium 12-66-7]OYX50293.1 MAG: hypothetical protein B7Y90_04790 [Alphaproteobacteria bacterium 32-64-14]
MRARCDARGPGLVIHRQGDAEAFLVFHAVRGIERPGERLTGSDIETIGGAIHETLVGQILGGGAHDHLFHCRLGQEGFGGGVNPHALHAAQMEQHHAGGVEMERNAGDGRGQDQLAGYLAGGLEALGGNAQLGMKLAERLLDLGPEAGVGVFTAAQVDPELASLDGLEHGAAAGLATGSGGQRGLALGVEFVAVDVEQMRGIAVEQVDQRLVGGQIRRNVVMDDGGDSNSSHVRFNRSCHNEPRSSPPGRDARAGPPKLTSRLAGSLYRCLTMARALLRRAGVCERESFASMNGVLGTAKTFLLPAAIGALVLYFCYHALAGDQGLAAWAELQTEEAALEKQIVDLESQRADIQESLARLRDRTMDMDYVEEIARTKLSYVRPDELLVSAR